MTPKDKLLIALVVLVFLLFAAVVFAEFPRKVDVAYDFTAGSLVLSTEANTTWTAIIDNEILMGTGAGTAAYTAFPQCTAAQAVSFDGSTLTCVASAPPFSAVTGSATDAQVPNVLTLNLESSTLTALVDDEVFVGTGAAAGAYSILQNCVDGTESLDWNGTAFVCNTITGGSASNSFETHNAPAGTDPVAESSADTLNWTVTGPLVLTGTAGTDTMAFSWSGAFLDAQVDGSLESDEVDHDATSNFVAAEHVDWAGVSAGTIHTTNYVDNNTNADTICTGTDNYLDGEGNCDVISGGGAPTTVDYLVGTADAGLSNEIVVGTAPGGELGGTWATPTIDATHSGSAHHAVFAPAANPGTDHSDLGATPNGELGGTWAAITVDATHSGSAHHAVFAPNADAGVDHSGLTATMSEINTPLDGALVQLTEFRQLESIGTTTISANQWTALGGIAETLTFTELNLLDGITVLSGSNTGDNTGTDTLDDLSDDLPTALSNVTTITNGQFCVGNAGGGFDCTTAGALADDDVSDDLITALSGVTTVTDGSYCQGGAGSGVDCDVAIIPIADGGTGAGTLAKLIGAAELSSTAIQAGDFPAGGIDGDDIASNLAGKGLDWTAGAPDQLDAATVRVCKTLFDSGNIAATDDVPDLWSFNAASTVTDIDCISSGGTNVVVTIEDDAGNDLVTSCTCTTSWVDCGAVSNATMTADERLDWTTVSVSGSATSATVCVDHDID